MSRMRTELAANASRIGPSGMSGSERNRRRVAAKMALAIAGATAISGVSPAPAGGKPASAAARSAMPGVQ